MTGLKITSHVNSSTKQSVVIETPCVYEIISIAVSRETAENELG